MVVRLRPGRVTFDPGEPTAFVVDPSGPVIRDLDRRMTRAQVYARSKVGVASGLLLSTIRKQPGFRKSFVFVDLVAGLAGKTPYMGAHHEGSPPHEIRPRRRKTLRFVIGGQVVFRSRVMHPGTKANPFLTDALPLAGADR